MNKICKVHLIIEKRDSDLVPYAVVHHSLEFDGEVSEQDQDQAYNDLGLIETEHIPLPAFSFKMEVGDYLEFSADLYCEAYSYMTDCGMEHDCTFEFRNTEDLRVWRPVFEASNETL